MVQILPEQFENILPLAVEWAEANIIIFQRTASALSMNWFTQCSARCLADYIRFWKSITQLKSIREVGGYIFSSAFLSKKGSQTNEAALLNFQLKLEKKVLWYYYTPKRLNATQLQHILKQPRDGLRPPKVTFYNGGLRWHLKRLLGCPCIFSAGLCNINSKWRHRRK